MIGAQTLHATGYAMGVQRDGAVGTGDPDRDAAVIAHFGDGACSQGDVNEAFIFAASYNAPVVFFCQNNQWAISEPIERQTRIPLYQRALRLRLPRHPGRRQRRARDVRRHEGRPAASPRGQGPTFVEAYTYRMGAHTTTDDPTRYRLSDDVERVEAQGPDRPRRGLPHGATAWPTTRSSSRSPQEADDLGHQLREGCKALPDPKTLDMFDHVYAEQTESWSPSRPSYAAYLDVLRGRPTHDHAEGDARQGAQHGPAQGDGGRPQGPA